MNNVGCLTDLIVGFKKYRALISVKPVRRMLRWVISTARKQQMALRVRKIENMNLLTQPVTLPRVQIFLLCKICKYLYKYIYKFCYRTLVYLLPKCEIKFVRKYLVPVFGANPNYGTFLRAVWL